MHETAKRETIAITKSVQVIRSHLRNHSRRIDRICETPRTISQQRSKRRKNNADMHVTKTDRNGAFGVFQNVTDSSNRIRYLAQLLRLLR